MCEFFVIDKAERFLIFNLTKDMNKPVRIINFAEKHQSAINANSAEGTALTKISLTCADQTFFTSFILLNNEVQLYMMNFKKGSQITRAALTKENMKSANILKTLPINMDKEDQVTDML